MTPMLLKRPIIIPAAQPGGSEQRWDTLTLRDIEAGDVVDAGREMPDNASQTEMQLRVAAKCADLPFVIIRKMKPVDIVQVEAWWRKQWLAGDVSSSGGETEGENPSKAEGTEQAS